MNEMELNMIDDLSQSVNGPSSVVARTRWKQGYKTGRRIERERILALIEIDAQRWAGSNHRVATVHRGLVDAILAGVTK